MSSYGNLNYEKFSELAAKDKLSSMEKLGFGNEHPRKEKDVFADIMSKVPNIEKRKQLKVLDIGSGCGSIPEMLTELCSKNKHKLFLSDSENMLNLIPEHESVKKIPGKFPDSFSLLKEDMQGEADIIICYSVFHCGIFKESNIFDFIDALLLLLNEQGQCIVGDIPNLSKRKRFFASNTGKTFHKNYMQTSEDPEVLFNVPELGSIDESVLQAMVSRCHNSGFDAYIVPQDEKLHFSNRRDDLLIRRP